MGAGRCWKCGAELIPGVAFCGRCGAPAQANQPPGPPQPTVSQPPPRPGAAPAPAGMRSPGGIFGNRNAMYAAIAAGVAILLIGGVLIFTGGSKDQPGTAPGEVFLEPVAETGANPFTPTVDTNTAPPPVRLTGTASTTPIPGPSPTPAAPVGVRSVQGPAPGLYGGTRNESACDAEKMIGFLTSNPTKAAAWAAVQGITAGEIPEFVRGLTPLVLRADTRVTNHGYRNGRATPLQAVLQAGTAVLVDDLGVPRVKCGCGNPLAPPKAQRSGVRYTGNRWKGFRPNDVIVVVNTTLVQVTEFVVVDLVDPGYFVRPIGNPPPGETPADGEVLTDSVCDLFPEDCQGTRPGEPVLGTGDVQVTLRWNSGADLDLSVTDPTGQRVNFENRTSASGGQLDVDSNSGCTGNVSSSPVENVFWPTGQSPDGVYTIDVSYYRECPTGSGPQSFELTVLMGGQPVPVQPLSAGDDAAKYILLAANRVVLPQAAATGTLNAQGDKTTVTATKGAPPPGTEPPSVEPPAQPETPPGQTPGQPESLEDYCTRLYPDPSSMDHILCMHDPTTADVSDSGGASSATVS